MKLLGALLWVGARTPLLDAGVVLVPGLASQSLVGNNTELRLLFNQNWMNNYGLWAIHSNYEPPPTTNVDAWWKFWKKFRLSKGELRDTGVDMVFPDKNDLVVDMASMRTLGAPQAIKFVRDKLKV